MQQSSHFSKDLKLKKSFRSPAHQASVGLARTASSIKYKIEQITKKDGISLSQFNILRILRGAGGPLPTMEVSQRMVEIEPGITRLLVRLEKKSLVSRQRSETDARTVNCSITGLGLLVLDRLDGPIAQLEERILSHLTIPEVTSLNNILSRLHKKSLEE